MTDREIMQMALDALEYHTMQTRPINHTDKAIEALQKALAQPEQEPVAYAFKSDVISAEHWTSDEPPSGWTPLYTVPSSTSGYAKKIESLIKERDELRQILAQPERKCDVHECRRKVREADDDSSLAGAIIYRR